MRNTHCYGRTAQEFASGQRIATDPATGPFLQGDRCGTVITVGRRCVRRRLGSSRPWSTLPASLAPLTDH
ncbi:MAG: hypothetical protein O3A42_07155 [Actinobacteria bacterium]|nr:hypothetical protein [Actinomycetota bacterium]